ncbi:GNAT family N-acetyltransferase [Sphingomonas jatrophae]|uniref:Protein N-acetyltransferase, RimJ/RimL family n=1 Tax=Sphingomonas jatrophae TaxID=1166337 RepID=A0A1I6K3Q3_9SPHN|nr:GNAT family N-acetyltransferase [Sphingomonas jatrophae]SFR85817.1 Protein N-acetyltransferase, RimJ/RimL family [Sphingomonas jatrophae]
MFARTARLMLRPGWREDAPALHAAIADEAVVTKLARAPWPYALADAEAFLARPVEPCLPSLLLFERGEGAPRLVGGAGLHRETDGSVALGYWIAQDRWGRGYATEAGRAVVEMARALGHKRLMAGHFIDNAASGRVLAKLGFCPTGRIAACGSAARGRPSPTIVSTLVLADEEEARPLAA